jgi:hypothetical protein
MRLSLLNDHSVPIGNVNLLHHMTSKKVSNEGPGFARTNSQVILENSKIFKKFR